MNFAERVKLETKIAIQELLEAKMTKEEEGVDEEDEDVVVNEEEKEDEDEDEVVKEEDEEDEDEEDDPIEESLIAGAIVVGATATAIGTLVNNFKKRSREKEIERQLETLVPTMSQDIMRMRQRAKMISTSTDLDSFEKSLNSLKDQLSKAEAKSKNITLSEKQLNSLSWTIASPEKRLQKFKDEIGKILRETIEDLDQLETIAMQELNVRLGL